VYPFSKCLLPQIVARSWCPGTAIAVDQVRRDRPKQVDGHDLLEVGLLRGARDRIVRCVHRQSSRTEMVGGAPGATGEGRAMKQLDAIAERDLQHGEGAYPRYLEPETEQLLQALNQNEGLNVVEAAGYEIQGDVVILKELLEEGRAVVTLRADEDKVGIVAEPLRAVKLKVGDHILMDGKSGYLLEKLPKSEVEDLALEEVPDINYEDIGGLTTQIEAIKDAVELPYLYADYYREHQLTPPKGVLLYGPPGCGKTMIAKAVANNLAQKISEKRGEKVKGFF